LQIRLPLWWLCFLKVAFDSALGAYYAGQVPYAA
jgi:hypothetical protein